MNPCNTRTAVPQRSPQATLYAAPAVLRSIWRPHHTSRPRAPERSRSSSRPAAEMAWALGQMSRAAFFSFIMRLIMKSNLFGGDSHGSEFSSAAVAVRSWLADHRLPARQKRRHGIHRACIDREAAPDFRDAGCDHGSGHQRHRFTVRRLPVLPPPWRLASQPWFRPYTRH